MVIAIAWMLSERLFAMNGVNKEQHPSGNESSDKETDDRITELSDRSLRVRILASRCELEFLVIDLLHTNNTLGALHLQKVAVEIELIPPESTDQDKAKTSQDDEHQHDIYIRLTSSFVLDYTDSNIENSSTNIVGTLVNTQASTNVF